MPAVANSVPRESDAATAQTETVGQADRLWRLLQRMRVGRRRVAVLQVPDLSAECG